MITVLSYVQYTAILYDSYGFDRHYVSHISVFEDMSTGSGTTTAIMWVIDLATLAI